MLTEWREIAVNLLWSPEPIITIQHFFGASWNWLFQILTQLGTAAAVTVVFALAFWYCYRSGKWNATGI